MRRERNQVGPDALSNNPAIFNEFAAVFERVGHSMLTPSFLRIQNDGQVAPGGAISLLGMSPGRPRGATTRPAAWD